jgi:hypothetical protein
MTAKTIKLIVFLILLVHGIGHFQGVVTSLGIKISKSSSSSSWLLNSILGDNTSGIMCFLLYIITAISGIVAAMSFKGLIFPQHLWQTLVLLTAFSSAVSLILFPNALAMFFNKLGAIAVDIIIFLSLFLLHWPSEIFEN